nr:peptidoglycan DD-metalloendopeptidase family protein [Zophobihabitans entericus]
MLNKVIKIAALSSVALILAACTQNNPAVVKDISDAGTSPSSRTTIDNSAPTYEQRPSSIVSGTTTQPTSSVVTTNPNNNTVTTTTTTQERIVYTRNYEDIPKGGYQGNSYTVQRGDTLFYVAWITGNDYRALALKNNIKAPYELSVGQVLDVSGNTSVVVTEKTVTTNPATSTKPATSTSTGTKPATSTTTTTTAVTSPSSSTTTTTTTTTPTTTTNVANITWQWPAKGKVIETFSNATKGIDISGSLGDKVVAAAAGRVVYAGNALPGYGNLIIVKHNDDYLTAYAHNQSILVKEQQDVAAGQQIATMGNTGTSSVRLHFEIRYKAKSVDPLKYLPKQ